MLKYYYKLIQLFEALLNILIVGVLNVKFFFKKTLYPKKTFDSIQILGNGPSLLDDIPKITENRESSSIMVVNSFATSDLFEKLKPEYYIMVDPAFFLKPQNERIRNVQKTTLNGLINKTTWELILFVPYSAKKSSFIEKIENGNEAIKIIYFKNIPVVGGIDKINTFLFSSNLANPLYQNILNAAIFTALKMKFSEIYLWGADHSWTKDLYVDDQNQVIYGDSHVYDTKITNIIKEKPFHSLLFSFINMFKSHHQLNHFANEIGVKIYNCTKNSFIDAYERK